MNFLTLVFAFLLIFSFGALAVLEKQTTNLPLQDTFLGRKKANRMILSDSDVKYYKNFLGTITSCPSTKKKSSEKSDEKSDSKSVPVSLMNGECARLNLWSLVQEGKEEHLLLYQTALALLKTLYGHAFFDQGSEAVFLDLFLRFVKTSIAIDPHFTLEKLDFQDPVWQRVYYRMLKGTKEQDLQKAIGYPALLDHIEVDKMPRKVCIRHANPDQLAVFWGHKVAQKLHGIIHGKPYTVATEELVRRICSEEHELSFNSALFEFLDLSHPQSRKDGPKEVRVAKDDITNVTVRQNIYGQ